MATQHNKSRNLPGCPISLKPLSQPTVITSIDQRTPLCIGSANEVDRFNTMVLGK